MSTVARPGPQANSTPAKGGPTVIRQTLFLTDDKSTLGWATILPAWLVTGALHALFLVLFFIVLREKAPAAEEKKEAPGNVVLKPQDDKDSDEPEKKEEQVKQDLSNTDDGLDSTLPNGNMSTIIAPQVIAGKDRPDEQPGVITPLPDNLVAVPTPSGFDNGTGGAFGKPTAEGTGIVGEAGGMGNFAGAPPKPGGFEGRSASTRQQLVAAGGGNPASEKAVAMALKWIAQHQAKEGYWSLDAFPEHAMQDGKTVRCNCENPGVHNDVAGTAFGVLPFLGAGFTPTSKGTEFSNYSKNVKAALMWLMSIQKADGAFVIKQADRNAQTFMYSHGLATIAMCEAASMDPEPAIRESAQRAITFIVKAQHEGGGWRYRAGDPGDLSVVGWQVMALQSAKMAGLIVPTATFEKATKFLNQVQYKEDGGGYGYVSGPQSEEAIIQNPTMTAAGLLCREYLGWGPRNPDLIKGVERLSKPQLQPNSGRMNMYFYYYATQVMHHFGGQSWKDWNENMRDLLIKKQETGAKGHEHQLGSFSPVGDQWGGAGGRLMETSLCTLTLEVYYRHLPLYRQELAGVK